MEIPTGTAASQLGVSQRQVQRLARSGRIIHRSVAGRTVVAGRSLVAASRSMARGRRWDERTVVAASELLEHGVTEQVSGSQRSRLRARLRRMSVAELAYQALGERVSLWRSTQSAAAARNTSVDGLSAAGSRLEVTVTQNAAALARQTRMIEDADGETILIELDTDAPGAVEDIALYAYGDERTSSAASQRIEARQATLA